MTIKIENEALFCISNSAQQSKQLSGSRPASPKSPSGEEDSSDCILYFPNYDANLSEYSVPPGAIELDDDELTTASSCSSFSTSCSSEASGRRRVSWCSHAVSEVRTRPRTPPQEARNLFYSSEETEEFRRQYRRERELEAERKRETASQSSPEPPRRRHISRVVVLHNDSEETYFSEDRSVEGPNYYIPTDNNNSLSDINKKDEAFFDNDNFWSGSITWY
eukprot:CAMPEP_0185733502 /NCGR_PEP_ID=MMETSP1171-20130828/19706_1 /TAXON_ID=374046 /ORGANISM="Helicotheca tamensis, Strain CCMP826" /LENGTH=220 /DNA_ID=CAMNT_0028403257 /DNA_START=44 /DNA_END=706 /DNA_ORIENTATION=+